MGETTEKMAGNVAENTTEKNSGGKHSVKGIKIRNVNSLMIVVTCIIYMVILFLTVKLYKNYEKLEDSTQSYIACQQVADQLKSGSDYMTEQVRLYAETGDINYAQAYFTEVNETRRRDRALEELVQMGVKDGLESEMEYALEWSNDLMEIECYSMRLTAEAYETDLSELPEEIQQVTLSGEDAKLSLAQKEKKGRMLVFDSIYGKYKNNIYTHLTALVDKILMETQSHITKNNEELSRSLSEQRIMITILFILNLVMFAFIIRLVIRPLRMYLGHIQNDTMFDPVGSYEFQYLASTYNEIYQINTENQKNLQYFAEHDKLTDALNRTAFDKLTRCLENSRINLAIVIIDVDKFKTVNDTYGHETGDAVLKKVANVLQHEFRKTDTVVRYGGDEFVVIMTEITPEHASVISRKVNEVNGILKNPTDGLPVVSISAGAAFSDHGYDEATFKKADEALYEVKKNGRGDCGFAG